MSWCIKHPEYSKENDRINSYIHARTRSFVSECRIELAEAGFFYAGKKDQTICFYCGGGLHHWQDIDDPWEEHAKWFPKCPFVLVHKGQDFVNEMRSRTERNALQKKRIPTNNIAVPPPIEESNIESTILSVAIFQEQQHDNQLQPMTNINKNNLSCNRQDPTASKTKTKTAMAKTKKL
ncbi:baculoviral IAP repeat-containing protein 7-A-like [Macrosteles quadrilineatus]|uniref:baculoviral IAP repeat-containing protein 7-A-like n=1 Tax=Macrosteles quadrilineatus TaxID=74068 RepID=UPI0023E0ED18|nr:baculoviral IAP repeat-containing protein 7-A-like [Macrosteles quadrilineatus]